MRKKIYNALTVGVSVLIFAACSDKVRVEQETESVNSIVVYATGNEAILKPVFDVYANTNGVEVELVVDSLPALMEEIHKADGLPTADLFLADNSADLWHAGEDGIFRPIRSEIVEQQVTARLRDPEMNWVALAVRARSVVYNTEKVEEAEVATISNYESLTDERWRQRVCLSSSAVPGNGSLIAMLINDHGPREAELIVRGWRANLAQPLFADDEALLEAVNSGDCPVGLVDSDRVAHFLQNDTTRSLAPRWFPAEETVHINVIGGGVTRHSQNPEDALALLEWLSSADAGALLSTNSLMFPANAKAAVDPKIANWSGFTPSSVNVATLGYLQEDAEKLAERARYP